MKLKLCVGSKGQVVIPKIVRESLGIKPDGEVFMELKENSAEIKPVHAADIVQKWEERAKKHGGDVTHWVYGDKLYEEAF